MTIKYYNDLVQRSPEWYAARCGMLTSSEMENIITPSTLKLMAKKKEGEEIDHLWELLSQRINQYVEPTFQSYDMLRGYDDELDAKRYYEENYAPVKDCGFVTNDKWGFTLGYSPDGLVGDDGLIEVKGRKQKFQIQTIMANGMPDDFRLQVQTGLLVTERSWCDFISFCGGMPMRVIRIEPDLDVQQVIFVAALAFHERLDKMLKQYAERLADKTLRLVPTERRPPDDEIKGSAA